MQYEAANQLALAAPSRAPSNETTSTAAAFVHILEIRDIRYDIRAFGGKAMVDMPAQLGINPDLDATVSAAIALYRAHQSSRPRVDALARYGNALAVTRKVLTTPDSSPLLRLQMVLILFICQVVSSRRGLRAVFGLTTTQALIDRKNADRHRIMVAHVFREAVINKTVGAIDHDYVEGLCRIAV